MALNLLGRCCVAPTPFLMKPVPLLLCTLTDTINPHSVIEAELQVFEIERKCLYLGFRFLENFRFGN